MTTAALLSLGLAVFVAPSPALAAGPEDNVAVAASEPSDKSQKATVAGATVYFVENGDTWYVKDTAADGASAVAFWENFIDGKLVRGGTCINQRGNQTWGSCAKDYVETSTLRFKACVLDQSENEPKGCSETFTYRKN